MAGQPFRNCLYPRPKRCIKHKTTGGLNGPVSHLLPYFLQTRRVYLYGKAKRCLKHGFTHIQLKFKRDFNNAFTACMKTKPNITEPLQKVLKDIDSHRFLLMRNNGLKLLFKQRVALISLDGWMDGWIDL